MTNPGGFNLLGQPNLVIKINREKAARYGFSVGDVNAVVQAAIGGQEVTRVYEGEMNFALTVRFAPEYRRQYRHHPLHSRRAARTIPRRRPPISRSASSQCREPAPPISIAKQPALRSAQIQRARPRPRLDRGRCAAGRRREGAAAAVLPHGGTGEFGAMVDAQKRLAVIVPLSLILIMMLLLYSLFNSMSYSLLALLGHSLRGGRRHSRALRRRAEFQHLGSHRLHLLFGVSSMDGSCWFPTSARTWRRASHAMRRSSSPVRPACADFHDWLVGVHRPGAGGISTGIGRRCSSRSPAWWWAACCCRRSAACW